MFSQLNIPLMCAPMSFASSISLAASCCEAGIIGGWQGGSATSDKDFLSYLERLDGITGGPPIVNIPARWGADPTFSDRLEQLGHFEVPLVLSSVGDPTALVERVNSWGGKLIQDVTTMRHARKAIAAGADGLMLTCSGAGGHTGFLSPMAFVPAIRREFDGLLIVAGGIADSCGIAAALALGADIACMGTRFIATPESGVVEGHRGMIPTAGADDIMVSAAMNGVPANWIRQSIENVGLNPSMLPETKISMPQGVRPWRDIWSAGQSVALIDEVEPVTKLVQRLTRELAEIVPANQWRPRLEEIAGNWSR